MPGPIDAQVFCAVVSHPADNLVSKLNANKGATISGIVDEMGWCALPTCALICPPVGLWHCCTVLEVLCMRAHCVPCADAAVAILCPVTMRSIPCSPPWVCAGDPGRGRPVCLHPSWVTAMGPTVAAYGLSGATRTCRVALATRGLPLRIVMIGTLTGLQWGIYDAFKVYVGL